MQDTLSLYNSEKAFGNQMHLVIKITKQLEQPLHRSIGAITFYDGFGAYAFGSGILISKNMFLTAAHNVFDKLTQTQHTGFKVYFGAPNGISRETYYVQGVRYMKQQFQACDKTQKTQFDFALVKLEKEVQYNEFIPLSPVCKTCLLEDNKKNYVELFGFPKYQQNYTPVKYGVNLRQYGFTLQNEIVEIDTSQHKICYRISTFPGHSGSPVVVDNKIIAIHVGAGNSQQSFNIGRMVDLSLFTQLEDWCRQLNGHPFQFCSNDLCAHLRPTVEVYLKEKQERKTKQTTTELKLQWKQLKQINVSEYTNLTVLYLFNNKLYAIDVTKNTNLTHLQLFNNQLSAIDVTKNTNLTHLYLYNNQLSAIDVTKNTNLTQLYLGQNQLSAIDVTKNTNLTFLYLYNNQLSAIDVTKNTNLTHLSLFNNQLSAIDVFKNTNLTHSYLSNNQLSAIDVTKNTELDILWLQNNRLETVSLSFVASKPIEKYLGSDYFNFFDQLSAVCEIQIHFNSAGKSKCSELKEGWAKKYGGKGGNKHGCKYAFSVVEK